MSFTGWTWSQGANTKQRQADVRAIMALSPNADELLAKYDVDFVVIGPNELEKMDADRDGFRRRFKTIVHTENYDVFDVKDAAPGATSSSKATPGPQTPAE